MISRDINDDFMVLIKGVGQDPDMGVKIVHLSIYYYSEATNNNSDKEEIITRMPQRHQMMVKT